MLAPPGSTVMPQFFFGASPMHLLEIFAPSNSPIKGLIASFTQSHNSLPLTLQLCHVRLEAVTLYSLQCFPWLPLVDFLLETMV